jgi:hypothetical protein
MWETLPIGQAGKSNLCINDEASNEGALCIHWTRGLSTRVARWHIFQTKNPNLGKFWRVLQWKMFYGHLVYFTAILYILCTYFVVTYLVYFVAIFVYLICGDLVYFVSLFCGYLVYFVSLFCGYLVYFPILVCCSMKIWQPYCQPRWPELANFALWVSVDFGKVLWKLQKGAQIWGDTFFLLAKYVY